MKMRSILLLLIGGILIGCKSSKDICIGDAILIPKHTYIPIYKDKGIHIVDSIINDTIKESYPFICIYKLEGNYAYVSMGVPFNDILLEKKGWVELKYIGTNLAYYDDVVPVMKQPDDKSIVVFQINKPHWGDIYPIIDAYDKWLKIQNVYDPKEIGWVAPEYQCNNPYTSCN